ncbi:hypothetical protein [Mycolicibacterium thermoresistibile]
MSQNRSCGSYGAGHLVHWVQAKKARELDEYVRVKVIAVHDDGHIDIEGDDLNLTMWHHNAKALGSAMRFGGRAEWYPKFRLLYVISVGMFHLGYPDRVQPCVPPARRRRGETAREFIERAMRENHGYTVPQRWLANLDAVPDGEGGEPKSGFLVGIKPSAAEKALLRKVADEFGHRLAGSDSPTDPVEGR